MRDHEAHQLGERARELDPGGAAADDAEREEPAALAGVVRRGGAFEAVEHVVAELERLAEILEPQRTVRDRVVAVEVGRAPRCEHERVVFERGPVGEADGLLIEVDVDDVAQPVPHVRRAPEHLADRRGDLGRVQETARHLVQQRCEEVVVLPVDERHVERRPPQRLRALEPAEAGADDDDPRTRTHGADCRMNASSWPICSRTGRGECSARCGGAAVIDKGVRGFDLEDRGGRSEPTLSERR